MKYQVNTSRILITNVLLMNARGRITNGIQIGTFSTKTEVTLRIAASVWLYAMELKTVQV